MANDKISKVIENHSASFGPRANRAYHDDGKAAFKKHWTKTRSDIAHKNAFGVKRTKHAARI